MIVAVIGVVAVVAADVAVVGVVAVAVLSFWACDCRQQLLGNTEDLLCFLKCCRALGQNPPFWLPGWSYFDCTFLWVSCLDCSSLSSILDCSLAKSTQGAFHSKVLRNTPRRASMHLGQKTNLTPASAQDHANSVTMFCPTSSHDSFPHASSHSTLMPWTPWPFSLPLF